MLIHAKAAQSDIVHCHELAGACSLAAGGQWRTHRLCYVERVEIDAQLTDVGIARPNSVDVLGGRFGADATQNRSFQRRRFIFSKGTGAADARCEAALARRGAVSQPALAATVTGTDVVVGAGTLVVALASDERKDCKSLRDMQSNTLIL